MNSQDLSQWPKVSVVVPALNEEREIGECLASLASQTFPDFEVIVVDNGSTDATPSIAARYGARVIREPKERIHRAFEEDPEVIAVFGPFRYRPGSAPKTPVRPFIPCFETGLILGQRVAFRLGLPHFPGANFAVRREAFFKVGGFHSPDGRIYSDWEDIQLGFKLRRAGKVRFLPDLVVLTSARKLRPASARNIVIGNAKRALHVHVLGKPL